MSLRPKSPRHDHSVTATNAPDQPSYTKGLSTILRMNTSRVVRFTDSPRGPLRAQCRSGVLLVASLDPAVAVPQATTGKRSAQGSAGAARFRSLGSNPQRARPAYRRLDEGGDRRGHLPREWTLVMRQRCGGAQRGTKRSVLQKGTGTNPAPAEYKSHTMRRDEAHRHQASIQPRVCKQEVVVGPVTCCPDDKRLDEGEGPAQQPSPWPPGPRLPV